MEGEGGWISEKEEEKGGDEQRLRRLREVGAGVK